MSATVWFVTVRPSVRELFSASPDIRVEFIGGLVQLLRRRDRPDVICVDAAEHDLHLSDVGLKMQLRFPTADILALYDSHDSGQTRKLIENGIDGVVVGRDEWISSLRRILEQRELVTKLGWTGKSDALRQLAAQTLQAAASDIAVLITGESGTGKELVARALHDHSSRARRAFMPVNTGAIPETLLESELFGHEKGAFTGAVSRHEGIFEAARGGTVFLDEIGDMPAATQVKLLRVIESRRFRRVGGTVEIETDVRVLSATHRDLMSLEQSGAFRRDLYYRLSAITLHASPLRERRGDILPLLEHFWRMNASGPRAGGVPTGVDSSAVRILWNYSWPGNVRELRNFADAASVAAAGSVVTEQHVLQYVQRQRGDERRLPAVTEHRVHGADPDFLLHAILHLNQQVRDLRRILEERLPAPVADDPAAFRAPSTSIAGAERRAIETALFETSGNRKQAARKLGIGERTLYRKLKDYGLR
jgi:DNA-binding NtrC family response regulator